MKVKVLLVVFISEIILLFVLFTSPAKHLFFYPETDAKEIFTTVDQWIPNAGETFGLSSGEYESALSFVKDSLLQGKVFSGDSAKTAFICNFIDQRLGHNTNASEDYSHFINPWKQWLILDGQHISTYCVGYATVYQLFSTIAGLKTRMIAVSGNKINHIFCETYIEEKKQWALTDIMFKNVLVYDAKGNYINSDNYRGKNGECILVNKLCAEYENATNFKYYKSSFYDYGYAFDPKSMAMRILSPQAETIVKGEKPSFYRYYFLLTLMYVTAFTFMTIAYVFVKGSRFL